ncbi:MAG: hypothetical protein QXT80_03005 [Thermoplasmatales archaeon]
MSSIFSSRAQDSNVKSELESLFESSTKNEQGGTPPKKVQKALIKLVTWFKNSQAHLLFLINKCALTLDSKPATYKVLKVLLKKILTKQNDLYIDSDVDERLITLNQQVNDLIEIDLLIKQLLRDKKLYIESIENYIKNK